MPKRILEGLVISNKMEKTVTVRVERKIKLPLYKKFIKRSKKYTVHDEMNSHKDGDRVFIRECRPISKLKRWEIVPQST